jgi:N-acetylglucosaminyldiphosphoundecaprenol N-acetyl-beta-D-mannosaminyltransferase
VATSTTQILGVPVETDVPQDLLARIVAHAEQRERLRVSYVNAHVLNQSQSHPELLQALRESDMVYCDGYGVRLAARLIGLRVPHRMTGADWIWHMASLCERSGRSIYLLGSDPGASAEAAERLRERHPGLKVLGTHHGYFGLGSPHSERVLEHIAEHRPDVLLVGMGTPAQELWVHQNADRIEAPVVWTVGALFDYVSGRVPRAPRWLADNGFEWIFRLAVEPRRMWRRYLLGNPAFLLRVLRARRTARS